VIRNQNFIAGFVWPTLSGCRGQPPHPNAKNSADNRAYPAQFHWDRVTADDYGGVFKQAHDVEGSDDGENQ